MSSSGPLTVTKSRTVQRERPYDYLYDPDYTVPSQADHTRAAIKSFSKQRFRKVPDFETLFTHRPSYTIRPDHPRPPAAFTDQGWQGHQQQRSRALLHSMVASKVQSQQKGCQTVATHYWKYYKRPEVPLMHSFPTNVIVALPKEYMAAAGEDADPPPRVVTVGVQTDYKESETQTDPYSCQYVVDRATTPSELLYLANLTWGHGLPAGQAELEIIERALAKRAWEASLPPLSDPHQINKRIRMIKERTAQEWAYREQEIQKLEVARLAVLEDLLRKRDQAQKDVTDHAHLEKEKELEMKKQKIRHDLARALRKLEAKSKKSVDRVLGQHRILKKSKFHVPKAFGEGIYNMDSSSKELKKHFFDTDEVPGLAELDRGLQLKTSRPKVMKGVIKPPVDKAVETMCRYMAVKEEIKERAEKKHLRFLRKKEKPPPRPVTPTVEEPPEGEEEKELAVIHLQKLLRGCTIRIKMFKYKEENMDLIQQHRAHSILQRTEQELQNKENIKQVSTLKNQKEKYKQKDVSQTRVEDAELDQLEPLSKDLIRLQEERRIHAFMLLAERERRLREAEESGRRQVEEQRMKEEDEIFKQVVAVHQETVDLYLEDVILGVHEEVTNQQEREELYRRLKEINDIVYAKDESSILQSEEIVSELMYSFLIPESEEDNFKQKVHQKQSRHLQAAQSIIQGSAEASGNLSTSPQGSQRTQQPSAERASHQLLEELLSRAGEGEGAEEQHTPTE